MKPAVSVILTTYNRPFFLREAVDSILAQTLKNLDLVIVDDGSETAETEEICRHYTATNQRIKYVRQANAGVAVARNRGVRESSADLIIFMDDDDILHPRLLEKEFDFIKQNPRIVAVTCNYADINKAGKIIRTTPSATPMVQEKSQSLWDIMKTSQPFHMSPKTLIYRDIYIKEGGYDERFRIMEEVEFGLRLAEKYATGRIYEDLYFARIHNHGNLYHNPRAWGYNCAVYVDAYFRQLGEPLPASHTLTDILDMAHKLPPPMLLHCTRIARSRAKHLLRSKNYSGLSFLLSQFNATFPSSRRLKTKLYGRLFLWSIYYGKFGGIPTILKNMTKQHK